MISDGGGVEDCDCQNKIRMKKVWGSSTYLDL